MLRTGESYSAAAISIGAMAGCARYAAGLCLVRLLFRAASGGSRAPVHGGARWVWGSVGRLSSRGVCGSRLWAGMLLAHVREDHHDWRPHAVLRHRFFWTILSGS
ncbi:hypothetical protein JCM9533A_69130 [Catenuloplanes niger JCM 9533]